MKFLFIIICICVLTGCQMPKHSDKSFVDNMYEGGKVIYPEHKRYIQQDKSLNEVSKKRRILAVEKREQLIKERYDRQHKGDTNRHQ